MKATLYNQNNTEGECSILLSLKNKDILEIIKIRDTIVDSMYMPYWKNLLKLLNNIILETQKKDEQGIHTLYRRPI